MKKKQTFLGLRISIFQSVKALLVHLVNSAVKEDGFWDVGLRTSAIKLTIISILEWKCKFLHNTLHHPLVVV